MLTATARAQAVLPHPLEEGGTTHAEPSCRLGLVAPGGDERRDDERPLERVELPAKRAAFLFTGASRFAPSTSSGAIVGRRGGGSAKASGPISPPAPSATMRATAFSSCRTLPGQSASRSFSTSAGDSVTPSIRNRVAYRRANSFASGGHVVAVLAQGRDDELHHRQAVVEILPEPAGADLRLEVAVRGRDHPHVDLLDARGADGLDLALLQDAEELRLEPDGELANLVEDEGPAVGLREEAAPGLRRAGERAARVAEQLGLGELLRDRAAVEAHERAVRARRPWAWTIEAMSSLPVPVSPRTSTVTSFGATRATSARSRRIGADSATKLLPTPFTGSPQRSLRRRGSGGGARSTTRGRSSTTSRRSV